MEFGNRESAEGYAIVFSIVYQFGRVGLEVDQIKEFSKKASAESIMMIIDSWVPILFDENFNLKGEMGDLKVNTETKRVVAVCNLKNEEEDIISDFCAQLEDLMPEDFVNG